jgi:hypothetical protein
LPLRMRWSLRRGVLTPLAADPALLMPLLRPSSLGTFPSRGAREARGGRETVRRQVQLAAVADVRQHLLALPVVASARHQARIVQRAIRGRDDRWWCSARMREADPYACAGQNGSSVGALATGFLGTQSDVSGRNVRGWEDRVRI